MLVIGKVFREELGYFFYGSKMFFFSFCIRGEVIFWRLDVGVEEGREKSI